MIKLFKRKRRTGCPLCYDSRTIGFGTDLLESKYDSQIEEHELIGETQTFKCHRCNSVFYIEGNLYQKIEPERIQILNAYWETEHKVNPRLMSQLELIGFSTDWNSGQLAPGRIELIDGRVYEFATIRICRKPPINSYSLVYQSIFFIDEIANISPSKFALSKEIRVESSAADEMRMGFCPTVLRGNSAIEAVINIETLFFKNGNIVGSDLRLANENWNHRKKYLHTENIENPILVVAR